jgi:hypothetical protein
MNTRASKHMSRGARNRTMMVVVGMIAGGVGGVLFMRLFGDALPEPDTVPWSTTLAVVLGLVMSISGLIVVGVSFSARATARAMDPDSESRPRAGQTTLYRYQGLVLLLAGLMMGAPVIVARMFDPVPRTIGIAVLVALVALSLIQTALNLSIWQRADEMMRRMISEGGSACFWLLQGLFFLWAAAEVLGVAPALSAWDIMTLLMTAYLIVSSVIAIRRGFA